MQKYFADFHIHVGISEGGKWVKIPTSNKLTVRNILHEAAERKGMQIVGIVDALSPLVRQDLKKLLAEGLLELDTQGGYNYKNKLTLLLGAEIETSEEYGGIAHTLIFLPDVDLMANFAAKMEKHIKNINLSSQSAHMPLSKLVNMAAGFEGAIVPAHVFTPHKSLYGSCTRRIADILNEKERTSITTVELGLSADSFLADRIAELADYTFLTNSDAHSLEKIAREYNVLQLEEPSFGECLLAFNTKDGRAVTANYGLDPRLGKYHRTFCQGCNKIIDNREAVTQYCSACGSKKVVPGVLDRINMISDYETPCHPVNRPPYYHQVPLNFIPGLGKKVLEKLLAKFGSEMAVIHNAAEDEISSVAGPAIAAGIVAARSGKASIAVGGGGLYGKITKK